jgi:hypothetical protein
MIIPTAKCVPVEHGSEQRLSQEKSAREAIAKLLCGKFYGNPMFTPHENRTGCDRATDSILSLKGEGWRVAIVREKGELPRVEQPARNYTDVNFGYQLAQQDMLDAGWVQEVPEEVSNVQDSES